MRVCRRCRRELPPSDFPIYRDGRRRTTCHDCRRLADRERYPAKGVRNVRYASRSRDTRDANRPEHPFVTAANAIEFGRLTLKDVQRRHGQRFADIVAWALRERAKTRTGHAA